MPMNDKAIKEAQNSFSVENSPGSIIAPSGGNNNITNYFGPQPRNLEAPQFAGLKKQLLTELPSGMPITITAVMGDQDALLFGWQIYRFLQENGFKMRVNQVTQSVFPTPVKGLMARRDPDQILLIVGYNIP